MSWHGGGAAWDRSVSPIRAAAWPGSAWHWRALAGVPGRPGRLLSPGQPYPTWPVRLQEQGSPVVEHPQVGVVHGAGPDGQGGQVGRLALGKLALDEDVSHSGGHSPSSHGCWPGGTSALHSLGTPEKLRLGQEILMGWCLDSSSSRQVRLILPPSLLQKQHQVAPGQLVAQSRGCPQFGLCLIEA